MTEKAKLMLNKGIEVKFWQVIMAAILQLVAAAVYVTKLDQRVAHNEASVLANEVLIATHTAALAEVNSSRFKAEQGEALTQLVIANRERVSVVENNYQHIKEDIKSISESQHDILKLLRER